MKSAGLPGVCAAMLVFLTASAGYASAADNDAKPGKSEKVTEPAGKIEMDPADNPQTRDPEPIVIPLEDIWAHNMPGTLNVLKLASDPQKRLVGEIWRSLWAFPSEDKDARAGFAVSGSGLEVLRQVHAVLVEKKDHKQTFPTNSEISVTFFSYQTHPYVHLHRVERQGHVVNIRYRFVGHETEETTSNFALVPLGKLPPGKYRVNVIQSPMEEEYVTSGYRPINNKIARRIVCNSFSFSIAEQGE